MANFTPGTKIVINFPFERRPVKAIVSVQPCPIEGSIRATCTSSSMKGRTVNVYKGYCEVAAYE